MSNTKINYLYRDANNFKVHNEAVIEGLLTEQQMDDIINCLDEGEYFVPSAVSLPECKFDKYDPEADHPWFELYRDGFETTNNAPTVNVTAEELYQLFKKCDCHWKAIAGEKDEEGTL